MSRLKKIIPLSEFDEHNKPNDNWIVIDGRIYDVSTFGEQHPGGPTVLEDVCGRDATADFNNTGHSEAAKMMLSDYLVGVLSAEDLATLKSRK